MDEKKIIKLLNWIGENWIQYGDNKWVHKDDSNFEKRLTTKQLLKKFLIDE